MTAEVTRSIVNVNKFYCVVANRLEQRFSKRDNGAIMTYSTRGPNVSIDSLKRIYTCI